MSGNEIIFFFFHSLLTLITVIHRANYLYDELFRCQISMGSINEKIANDSQTTTMMESIHHYEEALKTAELLKSKRKKFDAYICLAMAWLTQDGQIDRVKSYLKKAYGLKINVEDDKERVVQLLKVTMAIDCDLKKFNETNDDQDLDQRILLCDRLGDHFVIVKCFQQAIKYYKKELLYANEANKSDTFVANIYVSIGQTYLDCGMYRKAIEYFKHEYNFQLGNTCEQCTSLLKIAEIQECLYRSIDDDLDIDDEKAVLRKEIIENYENCLKLFSDLMEILIFPPIDDGDERIDLDIRIENGNEKFKHYKQAIGNYLNFLETNKLNRFRQDELQELFRNLNPINVICCDDDNGKDDQQEMETINDMYDGYDIDLLSLEFDSDGNENDEEIPENFHSKPKRNPQNKSIRRLNQFGETPLHTACIAGNFTQVERLINQNVDINAKDFCGWTPLHEACNHGFIEIVEYLLKKGANIEAYDNRSDRITPLHDACNCGHFDIIRLLLNYNANVLARNSNDETPIECLISWRERCKNELSKQDIDQCLELEIRMIDLMKDKGFDPTKLFKRSNSDNSDANTTTTTATTIIRKRNLVKDHIYSSENSDQFIRDADTDMITVPDDDDERDSMVMAQKARQEYRNTIESIRYFGSKTKKTTTTSSSSVAFPLKQKQQQNALLNENEDMPRDDWLIDDMDDSTRRKHHHHHQRKRTLDGNEYFQRNDINKKLKSNKSKAIIGDSDISEINIAHNNYPVDDDDDDNFETFPSYSSTAVETSENYMPIIETISSTVKSSNPTITTSSTTAAAAAALSRTNLANNNKNNHHHNHRTNNNGNRKALTIHFDDSQKSSFIVFIENNSNCQWLKEELIRRYFIHYGMKPRFSLRTADNDDAILLDSDLVIDIVGNNERNIKAIIEQWTIDQPDKRYRELCAQQQQTIVDKNIENLLRKSCKNLYLNLNGSYFPSKTQNTLMMKALLQQNIKELVSINLP